MDKIVAPIQAQDKGPAVANLQQAMLFIVEKKQFSPADHSLDQWKQVMSDESAQQLFGQRTLQLLLALLPELHLPAAEFVTPAVADALNTVLQDLGAFAPGPTPTSTAQPAPTSGQWEYQMISVANATELLSQANTQGMHGWELVGVVVDTARPDKYVGFLKRKKQ